MRIKNSRNFLMVFVVGLGGNFVDIQDIFRILVESVYREIQEQFATVSFIITYWYTFAFASSRLS